MAKFSDAEVSRAILAPSAFREINFPGLEGVKVAVRCLSEHELQACRVAALSEIDKVAKARRMTAKEVADVDPLMQQRFVELEIIVAAFFDSETTSTDSPHAFFSDSGEVKKLSANQVADLIAAYEEHHIWSNPQAKLSPKELDEFVEAVKKAQGTPATLSTFDRDTLARLVISLASITSE